MSWSPYWRWETSDIGDILGKHTFCPRPPTKYAVWNMRDAERRMRVTKVKNALMEVITISGKLLVTASVIYPHAKIRLNLRRWRDDIGPFKRNHSPRILVRSWWNDFGAQSNLAQWSWLEDSSGFCRRFFSPQEYVSFTLRESHWDYITVKFSFNADIEGGWSFRREGINLSSHFEEWAPSINSGQKTGIVGVRQK